MSFISMFEDFNKTSVALHLVSPPAITLKPKQNLLSFVDDGILALAVPIIAYWSYSSLFHLIDVKDWCPQYRIHPPEEIAKRNKVSLNSVIAEVISQHIIQTLAGLIFYYMDEVPMTGMEFFEMWAIKQRFPVVSDNIIYVWYYFILSAIRIFGAFTFIDSWQYFLHRLMHTNRFLYKHLHSVHHRLYVPYAYGALYNHPLEGFLLDTLGSGLASMIIGLTPRECLILYTFATLKTVDDHCGYALPLDPFQKLFPNNAVYHDIHHQHFGIKTNYSQPFFTFWDKLLKTEYHGNRSYFARQKEIQIQKYKEFLDNRNSSSSSDEEDKKNN